MHASPMAASMRTFGPKQSVRDGIVLDPVAMSAASLAAIKATEDALGASWCCQPHAAAAQANKFAPSTATSFVAADSATRSDMQHASVYIGQPTTTEERLQTWQLVLSGARAIGVHAAEGLTSERLAQGQVGRTYIERATKDKHGTPVLPVRLSLLLCEMLCQSPIH